MNLKGKVALITGGGTGIGAAIAKRFVADGESFEVPPATIVDQEIKQTITADIVVIGAGTAGLVTALRAAEAGASVVVIAKSPSVSARGGSNFAIGSKLAKQLGQEFDWHDAYEKLLGLHSHRVNEQLWSIFANKSGEAMDWMCEKAVEAGLTPVLQHPMVGEYPGTHMFLGGPHGRHTSGDPQFDILKYFVDSGKQQGMKFFFNTRAEQLVRENDGRVSAVIAKTREGTFTKFEGRKAVVLAGARCAGTGHSRTVCNWNCQWRFLR